MTMPTTPVSPALEGEQRPEPMTLDEMADAKFWLSLDHRIGVGHWDQATMSRVIKTTGRLIATVEARSAEIARLREALRFVESELEDLEGDKGLLDAGHHRFRFDSLKRARAALEGK